MSDGTCLIDGACEEQDISSINESSNQLNQVEIKDTPAQNMATIADGGRELSKNILYVGNISKNFSNESLHELFSSVGNPFKTIKILQDKNRPGFNYAFVEYDEPEFATVAYNRLNNTIVDNTELKINFAFQTQQIKNNDTFNLFIGDLSLEVKDELLNKTFAKYTSLVQANVMWDMKTGRSRGYGFVCFNDKNDAIDALQTMNGFTIGDRPIKLNWASHRERNNSHNQHNSQSSGHINGNYNGSSRLNYYNNGSNLNFSSSGNNTNNPYYNNDKSGISMQVGSNFSIGGGLANNNSQELFKNEQEHITRLRNNGQMMVQPSYEIVLRQTPNWLSVVYLGNLSEFTTQNDLIPILQNFGYIVDFKILPEKGCAFVTYDTHDRAALAIVQLSGFNIHGRPLKCGWGKSARAPMIPINIARNNQQVVEN